MISGARTDMANKSFLETAKQLHGEANAILERISATQTSVTELLSNVKAAEKSLLEKEAQERRERQERERQERLRSVLASDKDLAVHVGGVDEMDEFEPQAAEETQVQPQAAAGEADKPAAAPVEPQPEPTEKQETVSAIEAGAEKTAQAPAEPKPAYEAHVISEPEQPQQSKPQQPVQSGYQARPIQQSGYQQRPQQSGYQQRPQQGGYQQRPQQGGYQQRPQQGGYQQRPQQSGARSAAPAAPMSSGKERVSNFDPNKSSYQRSYESDKKAKNKKAIQRENGPDARNWDDDGVVGNRKVRRGKQQQMRRPEPVVIEKAVITTEMISVKDLSEKIGKPVAEIIKKLFMLGIMATINQEIDFIPAS